MRLRSISSLFVLVMLWGLTPARASGEIKYYLALGDSLAQGVQPLGPNSTDILTNQGYADDLYRLLRLRTPGLQLVKLGCPDETTTTMMGTAADNPSPCIGEYETDYHVENQLDAAVKFLQTHPGQVEVVTLDIGGNDVDGCVDLNAETIEQPCLTNGLTDVGLNLPRILMALHQAADRRTLIIGMNYYDPFLAAWTLGPSGQVLAKESLVATTTGVSPEEPGLNSILETAYHVFGIPVADVANAFHITTFTDIPIVNIPLNVFLTLTWTWTGATPPDIHPNAAGYAAIAAAFAEKIATHAL